VLHRITVHLRNQWAGVLALFCVLAGGTAYAANTVFSEDIVDGEVKTADIAAGAVGTSEIKNNAVREADIGTGAVGSDEVADESLGSADLGPDSAGSSEVTEGDLNGLPVEAAFAAGTSADGCNPSSGAFVNCRTTNTISMVGPPASALTIVMASIKWHSDGTGGSGGTCNLKANLAGGGVSGNADSAAIGEANDTTNSTHKHTASMLGNISGPATSFFVECNETDADFVVDDVDIGAFGTIDDPTH
jgi:hypothetical protein